MYNEHNALDSFFVLERNSSSRVSEWYTHHSSTRTLVSLYTNHQNRKSIKKTVFFLLGFKESLILTFAKMADWFWWPETLLLIVIFRNLALYVYLHSNNISKWMLRECTMTKPCSKMAFTVVDSLYFRYQKINPEFYLSFLTAGWLSQQKYFPLNNNHNNQSKLSNVMLRSEIIKNGYEKLHMFIQGGVSIVILAGVEKNN